MFWITIAVIFVVSFIMALRSMRDFSLPSEIERFIAGRKAKGTIVFFGGETRHYKASHKTERK